MYHLSKIQLLIIVINQKQAYFLRISRLIITITFKVIKVENLTKVIIMSQQKLQGDII